MKKYIVFMGALLFASAAYADNTGEISAGASANEASPTTSWLNTGTTPDSTSASDDQRIVYTGTSQDTVYLTGFSMGVPAGATIDTIFVTTEAHGTAAAVARRRMVFFMVKDGTAPVGEQSDNHDHARDTDDTRRSTGATTPLFNTTWTVAEVNASTFGIAIWKTATQAGNMNLDHVTIYVAYTLAGEDEETEGIIHDIGGLKPIHDISGIKMVHAI